MNTVVAIVFFLSLGLILYAYVGYPIVLYTLSRIFGRRVSRAEITPHLSIIIAAYNEERDIGRKLEETLALDYPKEKMEIIVASDCSSDRTDEIVRGYAGRGVILHRRPQRLGKTSAQNHAVQISTGEILIFSDATTCYEKDALRKIVRNFADPQVGAVSGSIIYVDRSSSDVGFGARSYWGYEFFLRQCESRLSSLLGVCGCLYAVRRNRYVMLDEDMCSDFVIASEIYLQGQRTVFDTEAISSEDTNKRGRDEFWMRVRIIEQTISALHRYRQLLNPFRHGLFSWQMLSHKVMRYGVSVLLILAFETNALLFNVNEFYQWAFLAQLFFYSLAILGWAAEKLGMKLGPLAIPYYFTLSNAASLVAFVKYLRGQTHVTWEPLRVTDSSTEQGSSQTTREGAINGNLVR